MHPNFVIRGFNKGFDWVTRVYAATVDFLAKHALIAIAIVAALFFGMYTLFTTTPTSFIPTEDKGFFMVDVQLPSGASLNRTEVVMDRLTDALGEDEAVENVLSVNGYSILNSALQANSGMIIVKLKEWSERTTVESSQAYLQRKFTQQFADLPEAQTIIFGAPALPGIGAVEGLAFVLEDTPGARAGGDDRRASGLSRPGQPA